jgi:hypothetical protein
VDIALFSNGGSKLFLPKGKAGRNKRTFTRPVTKPGLRLARRHGFRPVKDGEEDKLDITYFRNFTQEEASTTDAENSAA